MASYIYWQLVVVAINVRVNYTDFLLVLNLFVFQKILNNPFITVISCPM